ncbi:uncharacterized protein DNG_02131 [Cephalotrichum gorgonifer]|uniref:NmrA-like domain-containing protein n=1 Tax=Cephalotrichum gorgonifer TaxID=2041049 RepID=A0AAE8MT25_9PEZI|nr:uncharacterized protein DNG_02131 [Cephalotrichum gorgonifer]
MPTVAIAGSGDMSVYLCEEFSKAGYSVTVLTRSVKDRLRPIKGVEQKVVDFMSVPQLHEAIGEAEALISTILDYTMAFTEVHLNLIEACKASPKCRRFIPSEFSGNLEDYPDQPGFYYANHQPVRNALRGQDQLEFTLLATSWLMDYILPTKNRHMTDVGGQFPINIAENRCVIPGTGKEHMDLVSMRDVAQAIIQLLEAPPGSWEEYICMSGEKTTMLKLADRLRGEYKIGLDDVEKISLAQLIQAHTAAGSNEERWMVEYQILTISGAGDFDPAKVAAHRAKYFSRVHF